MFSYNGFLVQVFYHLFVLIFLFIFFTFYILISNIFIFLWCRYEWKHRGLTHIHGFIWLIDAPNMDTLYWEDIVAVEAAIFFLTHMLQLGILVICTCQHPCCTTLQKMIHAVLHHHPYLHQTTHLTMKNL